MTTPPTPSLDEEPQSPNTSDQVQDRPRWSLPTPRDSLARIRPAFSRRTPMYAPTRKHCHSPHRTEVSGRSLLAKTPSWPSHLSAATTSKRHRRHQIAPPLRCRSPPDPPLYQASYSAPATSPHTQPARIWPGPIPAMTRSVAPPLACTLHRDALAPTTQLRHPTTPPAWMLHRASTCRPPRPAVMAEEGGPRDSHSRRGQGRSRATDTVQALPGNAHQRRRGGGVDGCRNLAARV